MRNLLNIASNSSHADFDKKSEPFKYRKTEIGLIPDDWCLDRLGNLGKFKNGINKSADDFGFGFPFVNLMDVFGKPEVKGNEDFGLINSSELDKKEYAVNKGDVLFIRSSVKPSGVGLTTVVLSDLKETVYSGFLIRFRSNEQLVTEFKKHCFYEQAFRSRIISGSTVSANTNINQDTLKEILIAFPSSKDEQIAIANALSDVDALIEELEKLIAKKQAIKTATMQQLLTGRTRLPPFGFEKSAHHPDGRKKGYKPSELGEIPEDWEVKEANTFSAFITKGSTPTTYGFDWEKDGVIFLRSECVSEIGLDLSESMFISEKANQVLNRSEVRSGDILVTITGNVGRAVFLDEKIERANINQHIARIRVCDPEVIAHYVYHFLSQAEVRRELNKITTGQAYPQLSLEQVRNIKVLLPSCAEQMIIASLLTEMDSEIQTLKRRLNKTRQIKQGMMQELLTGKTRLV